MDLYEILGVPKIANKVEIKKAYRELVKIHHPDKGGDEEVFKNISKAYETLSDDKKRSNYDRFGDEKNVNNGNNGGYGDFRDFMRGFYKEETNYAPKAENCNIQITLTLEEYFNGVVKKIRYNKIVDCDSCADKNMVKCVKCNGKGIFHTQIQHNMYSEHICDTCNGTGSVNEVHCNTCNNKKTRIISHEETITIPCSYAPGRPIIIPKEGNQKKGLEHGDLALYLKVSKNNLYDVDGYNLVMVKEIPYYSMMLGGEIEVPIIDGINVKFTINKNTKNESSVRLKGKGLYVGGEIRGDLYVVLKSVSSVVISDEEENYLNLIKKLHES